MTYEEKLAAQETIALPDRELLQAFAVAAILDLNVAAGGPGGAGGAGGPLGGGGTGGAGGEANAAQSSDLGFADAIAQN